MTLAAIALLAGCGDSGDASSDETSGGTESTPTSGDTSATGGDPTTAGSDSAPTTADGSGSGNPSSTGDGDATANDTASDTTGTEPVELEDGERTMIFSHVEYFCEGTEGSDPFAFIEFAFVDEGALTIVRTQTDCDTIPGFVPGRILGEQVTFVAPNTVERADGSAYTVELGGSGVVGYDLEKALLFVADADDAALVTNDDPAAYIDECNALTSTLNREVCLVWQIQLGELDPATCDAFTEVPMNFCQPYDGA